MQKEIYILKQIFSFLIFRSKSPVRRLFYSPFLEMNLAYCKSAQIYAHEKIRKGNLIPSLLSYFLPPFPNWILPKSYLSYLFEEQKGT